MKEIDVSSYPVTDDYFGTAYIDVDEWNELPTPHRYIHGGFEGTDTRFAYCFPPSDRYENRLFQPLEGANAGHENVNTGPLGLVTGGLEMAFRLGGYTVESNMGHIGDVMDSKAGPDPTIYGWRAAAESARFSKYVAAQVYGDSPKYAYVFGGSGGARRSPLCLAYAPDVWDAALPYMGDAIDSDYGDMSLVRNGAGNFASMFNVQRLLGSKIYDLVDAMSPGGSGDPFAGLNTHQREELATLYSLGYPRGDEFMIAQPMGQMWLWSSMAERLQKEDAAYFEAFWSKPGYIGHDQPEAVEDDILNLHTTVKRTLLPRQLATDLEFQGPEFDQIRSLAMIFAGMQGAQDLPMAVELDGLPQNGYRLGAGIKFTSGEAKNRQLYCISGAKDIFLCDGEGEASNLRLTGVKTGDEVLLDNRGFLAYCYYYRHHISAKPQYDFLRLDGKPLFEQYEEPEMSPFMGVPHTGQFDGKMMWVHHTHDASLWPPEGLGMLNNIIREQGAEKAQQKFRIRWTENAEHIPPAMAAAPKNRANNTWLVNYQPIIEQCLADLVCWVEQGVAPDSTHFDFQDGGVILPSTANERGGIQPVVSVKANGSIRAEVVVGETVNLQVRAEVPGNTGTIIAISWDFDGSGSYPVSQPLDDQCTEGTFLTTHSFDKPGTYFVTALVESHRQGEVDATSRRIPNLASARVVVS